MVVSIGEDGHLILEHKEVFNTDKVPNKISKINSINNEITMRIKDVQHIDQHLKDLTRRMVANEDVQEEYSCQFKVKVNHMKHIKRLRSLKELTFQYTSTTSVESVELVPGVLTISPFFKFPVTFLPTEEWSIPNMVTKEVKRTIISEVFPNRFNRSHSVSYSSIVRMGNRLIYSGGLDKSRNVQANVIEEFDTGIIQHKNMQLSRFNHSSTMINSTLYVSGGMTCMQMPTAFCEKLDLSNSDNKWEYLPSMNTSRYNHCMTSYNERVYVFGGESLLKEKLDNCELYTPELDRWVDIEPMDIARSNMAIVEYGDCYYIIGGYGEDGKELSSVEQFCVSDGKWTETDDLPIPIANASAYLDDNIINIVDQHGKHVMYTDMGSEFSEWKLVE